MSERPTDRERYRLSDEENTRIFREHLVPLEYPRLWAAESPSVHFFGAQPGAGKFYIQSSLAGHLQALDHPDAVMSIIGDEFRPYHPQYHALLAQNDEHAAFYTDADSARWIEQAIELSCTATPHVIVEGTLRTPAVTLRTAIGYRERAFATNLHVVAVHQYVSRLRIIGRYFEQVARSGHGRYTVREAHDKAYAALPASLAALAESGVLDQITLYDGAGRSLASVAREHPGGAEEIQAALARERAVESVDRAFMLSRLERYEDMARRYNRAEVLGDVLALREDMGHV